MLEISHILLLAVAGVGAGFINTVVGSGSLVSFPALLALGYPPVLANVTNNIGVLPGSISGAIGYRRELAGRIRSYAPMIASAFAGGAIGAVLLLILPSTIFDGVVPVLIAIACVLVVIGPRLKRRIAAKRERAAALQVESATSPGTAVAVKSREETNVSTPLLVSTGATGVYGGYFGAAQGVILLSLLSIFMEGSMQQANALKNVLTASANMAAAIIFVTVTQVDWIAAGLIALGAVIGGQLGAKIGRRIPEMVLRVLIVVVGVIAIVALVTDRI